MEWFEYLIEGLLASIALVLFEEFRNYIRARNAPPSDDPMAYLEARFEEINDKLDELLGRKNLTEEEMLKELLELQRPKPSTRGRKSGVGNK